MLPARPFAAVVLLFARSFVLSVLATAFLVRLFLAFARARNFLKAAVFTLFVARRAVIVLVCAVFSIKSAMFVITVWAIVATVFIIVVAVVVAVIESVSRHLFSSFVL